MRKLLTVAMALVLAVALAACTRTVDNTDGTGGGGEDLVAEDGPGSVDEDSAGGADSGGKTDKGPQGNCGVVGKTVNDLQSKDEGVNCVLPAEGESGFINLDQGVDLNCVIVTTPSHFVDDNLDGFYVEDFGGGAFSGIKVVTATGGADDVKVGDILDITGDLKEYYCLTEFDAVQITVTDSGDAPAPTAVSEADVKAVGGDESFEGVLVELENVTVDSTDKWGGFKTTGGVSIASTIFGDLVPAESGCVYKHVIGVVDFSYGEYKVLPRFAADVDAGDCDDPLPPEDTTVEEIQTSETSTTCDGEPFVNGGEVIVKALHVSSPRFVVSKDKLHGFFAFQGEGGENQGVFVNTDAADDIEYQMGDVIDITAEWIEYYCVTELKIVEHEKVDSIDGLIPVFGVTADDISADNGEPWEGSIVQLSDVEVLDEINEYGEFHVTGDIMIKMKFDGLTYEPSVGDEFTSIAGALTYDFGNYKIMPRFDEDIVQK